MSNRTFYIGRDSAGNISDSSSARSATGGFTLVETLVAMLVAAVLSVGVVHGVTVAKSLNSANEQRMVAFGMCKSQIEELSRQEFDLIASLPDEDIRLSHLGEQSRSALKCKRVTVVTEHANPIEHKEIRSTVVWRFRGDVKSETVATNVYRK